MIARLAAPYRAQGLEIYSVNIDKRQGADLAQKFKVDATPTTVVVDETDRPRKTVVGAVGNTEILAMLRNAVR
jgi:thioredoxin-related protein